MKTQLPFTLRFVRKVTGVPRHFYYQVNYCYDPCPWDKDGTPEQRAAHAVARDARNTLRLRYRHIGYVP